VGFIALNGVLKKSWCFFGCAQLHQHWI